MSVIEEYQDPDCDPRLERIFLMSDMHDAFVDHIDKAAIGTIPNIGMVALLRGKIEPIEIEGELFDEKNYLTLISFRMPGSAFDMVNIRTSEEELVYGQNIRLHPPEDVLAGLTEEDAIADEWHRHQIRRTQFHEGGAERAMYVFTENPLLLGVMVVSLSASID